MQLRFLLTEETHYIFTISKSRHSQLMITVIVSKINN